MFADVISSALKQHEIAVVGIAGTGRDGVEMASKLEPDVALVDLALPDGDGVSVGRELLSRNPDLKVLAVTATIDANAVGEALRTGFSGYITKETPLDQFVALIRSAVEGQVVIPQKLAAGAAGLRSEEERHALLAAEQLSKREHEVLTLLVDGHSSREMAHRLGVSLNTVRTHVESILTKLQVHSRLQAATFAVRYDIVRRGVPGPEWQRTNGRRDRNGNGTNGHGAIKRNGGNGRTNGASQA